MTRANCPSCGALVAFTNKATVAVICGSCRSVVRQVGAQLLADAKVSAVVEDASPICVGTTGRYKGRGFQVAGRLQVRHAAGGFWSEWALFFDDGRWAWLGDAMGQLAVYEPEAPGRATPVHSDLEDHSPGDVVVVQDVHFTVKEAGRAHVVGGEGELPCPAGQGWPLPFVDLADATGRVATIDYSDDPPAVYTGEWVDFDDFGFAGLREALPADHPMARVPNATVESVACPSCGGGLERRTGAQAQALHCPYCGAGIDVSKAPYTIFEKNDWSGSLPGAVPLGTPCVLEGVEWIAIGMIERHIPQWDVSWLEILFHNDRRGYRWLVVSNGHLTWVEMLGCVPRGDGGGMTLSPQLVRELEPGVRHTGRGAPKAVRLPAAPVRLRLRESDTVVVRRVTGEFYWQVKAGEAATTRDYVNAPWMLSAEGVGDEVAWSVGRYLDRDAVEAAFGDRSFPKPSGTVPHQPPPQDKWLRPLWWRWLFAAAACVVGAIATAATHRAEVVVSDAFTVALPTDPNLVATLKTDPSSPAVDAYLDSLVRWYPSFEVTGAQEALEVRITTDLSNGWMIAHGALFDETRGEAIDFQEEVSYYSGSDWSEGSRTASIILPSVPRGTYTFRFEPMPGEVPTGTLQVELAVTRNVGLQRWFGLAFAALTLPLLILVFSRIAFVARRDKVEED